MLSKCKSVLQIKNPKKLKYRLLGFYIVIATGIELCIFVDLITHFIDKI